jgi:hypothetical protein
LIVAAEAEKVLRLKREQREREWKEREQERLEEEERKRKEEEKIGRLEYLVNSWRKSQNIREFILAVEKAYTDRNSVIDPASDLANWLSWARRYADSIDPIDRTLRLHSKTEAGGKPDS